MKIEDESAVVWQEPLLAIARQAAIFAGVFANDKLKIFNDETTAAMFILLTLINVAISIRTINKSLND